MGYISVKDAALVLSVTGSRVRQLLLKGTINGKRFGPVWLVSRASVNRYLHSYRKPGPNPKNV